MKKLSDCYSRLLIDNHISDQKPEYMRSFSPAEYIRMVQLSGAESAMVYACDHLGNCYYPTRVGKMHGNLDGRDIFGETISGLRQADITPVAYYTVIYHGDGTERFPDSVIRDNCGNTHYGRYRVSCPNNDQIRQFYCEQIREIVRYPIAGLFIDMTFWPSICLCDACQKKFGGEFPAKIDWDDPEWIAFQRFREQTLAEFAALLTATAREQKPDLAVTHQFSPVLHGWYLGQSAGIAAASDYASGDFYGNKRQQRFAVKAFSAFTQRPPFEFMTSRCVSLQDHTSTKSDDEMFLSALSTLANGGAYLFIDAINPDGTLQENFYRRLHKINAKLAPFRSVVAENHLQLSADVGIFFSISGCIDRELNGKALRGFGGGGANNMAIRQNAVLDEALATAETLNQLHLPYRVVTDIETQLGDLSALIINNAEFLAESDCAKIAEFVRRGGTLIATGITSLQNIDGFSNGNFQLAELFGADFTGKYSDTVSFLGEEQILARGKTPLVVSRGGAEVRARLAFPDFPVQNAEHYAAIHSDPPGKLSEFPGLVVNRYGKGTVVYLAPPILKSCQYTQREFAKKLFAEFLPAPPVTAENLPGSAEITLLADAQGKRKFLTVVNLQDELPPIPLHQVKFTLNIPGVSQVVSLSTGKALPVTRRGEKIDFTLPEIQAGEFLQLS